MTSEDLVAATKALDQARKEFNARSEILAEEHKTITEVVRVARLTVARFGTSSMIAARLQEALDAYDTQTCPWGSPALPTLADAVPQVSLLFELKNLVLVVKRVIQASRPGFEVGTTTIPSAVVNDLSHATTKSAKAIEDERGNG
ncbi:MAG: hypothetical protein ABIW84_01815 [Ilumatobacteraceae bacterium]